MRKFYIIIAILVCATSCTDMLDEKMKTQVTVDYLLTTPDGLSRVVTGLYNYTRTIATDNQSDLFAYITIQEQLRQIINRTYLRYRCQIILLI